MNRRKFFGTLIGGVAAGAAVRTWPFRVFSFPSEPRIYFDVAAEIGKIMRNMANDIDRMMYTDGVGTGLTGIAYYETPPYPQLHFVGLERSIYPGQLKSA